MLRLPMTAALTVLLTAAGCFQDVEPAQDCNPGSEACRCDDGVCLAGLTCIDSICSADAPATDGMTTSVISASVTMGITETTETTGTGSSGTTTLASDPGSSTSSGAADSSSSSSSGEPFQHVMFTTQQEFTGGLIGSLEDADALCEAARGDGSPHRAILSDSTRSYADRIEIVGPVLNTVGQEVAADAEELWSGIAAADVGLDEDGAPIPGADLAWVGSAEDNCLDWNTDVFDEVGAFGVPTQKDQWLSTGDSFQCGLELHLYCISI